MTEENKKETNYMNDVMVGMHWAGDWFPKEDGNSENISRKKCASRSALSILNIESCVIMIERIDGISWEEWTIIIFFANFLSRNRVSGFGFNKVLDISYLWSFHLSLKFQDSWGSLLGISSKKRKNGKGLVEENLNLLLTIKSQFQSQCWAADWEL